MAYKQSQQRNQRLRKLYNETCHCYGSGAYYDEERKCYFRYYCHNKNYKKQGSRKYKRWRSQSETALSKSNFHKRIYDYWWQIF